VVAKATRLRELWLQFALLAAPQAMVKGILDYEHELTAVSLRRSVFDVERLPLRR
jgi:hypothetical protein